MAVKLLCLAAVLARASGFVAPTPQRPALRPAPLFDKLATNGRRAFNERAGSIDPTKARLSPGSEMRRRAKLRKEGKPLEPLKRGGEVPDFLKDSDPEANLLQQKIGFVLFGVAFLGLEAKQLIAPETEFNYSGNNDAFCAAQRAKASSRARCATSSTWRRRARRAALEKAACWRRGAAARAPPPPRARARARVQGGRCPGRGAFAHLTGASRSERPGAAWRARGTGGHRETAARAPRRLRETPRAAARPRLVDVALVAERRAPRRSAAARRRRARARGAPARVVVAVADPSGACASYSSTSHRSAGQPGRRCRSTRRSPRAGARA